MIFLDSFGYERPVFVAYIGSALKNLVVCKIIGSEVVVLDKIHIDLFEPGKITVRLGTIFLVDRNGKIVRVTLSSLAK